MTQVEYPTLQLRHIADTPVVNGVGEAAADGEESWPRYIRITDFKTLFALDPNKRETLPPEVAATAVVLKNDLLLAAVGATVGSAYLHISGEPACFAGYLVRVRCNPRLAYPKFVAYWTATKQFEDQIRSGAVGSTIENFSAAKYRGMRIPLPSLAVQSQIADYLDARTTKIDALIGKQERLIELLAERRVSVLNALIESISRARTVRLKYLFEQSRLSDSSDLQVLSVYRDHGVIPKSSRMDNFNKTPEDVSRYLLVRPGDLVVNKMKAWQGSLGISPHEGIVSGDYEVAHAVSPELSSQFAHYLLRSDRYISQYAERSVGIRPSQWRLYWDQLGEIRIPLPPVAEQETMVEQLERETSQIDALSAKSREMIDVLKERRQALISAAVTGKIDVRGLV